MKALTNHDILPRQSREEYSRHDFLVTLKTALMRKYGRGNRQVYETRAAPEFEKETGRRPETRHDVASAMAAEPHYQMWCALSRAQQELYVDSTGACVERQLSDLISIFRKYAADPKFGTLRLDPDVTMPPYLLAVDTHCVPGGYLAELAEDDVYLGARYDIGTFIFGRGLRGPLNDLRGRTGSRFIRQNFPDFRPRRILDLGCATGNNTLPYVDAFPDAEVVAIDVSAPCLRYAHARAEALGKSVHFAQQNAEQLDYENETFDVIVSHILFHETSRQAVMNIMKECFRLLTPGGLTVHVDVGRRLTEKTPYDQFIGDWDTFHNNEPFWGTLLFDMDMKEPAVAAGFEEEDVREMLADAGMGDMKYWIYSARKRHDI